MAKKPFINSTFPTRRPLDSLYNLARALDDGGRSDEAAAIFAELWERWPEDSRFGVHLLQGADPLGTPVTAG